MNALTAAKGLRRSVEAAGGSMRISVPALGDSFGRGKLTTRARTAIEQVLARAGLAVHPPLNETHGDEWVTLRVLEAGDEDRPPAAPPQDVWTLPRPPAAVLAVIAVLVPATIGAAVVAAGDGPATASAVQVRSATPAPSASDPTLRAIAAGNYGPVIDALLAQARTAQRERAYVRAIQLVRSAQRFGRTPAMRTILIQARAGLDLRRARLRR